MEPTYNKSLGLLYFIAALPFILISSICALACVLYLPSLLDIHFWISIGFLKLIGLVFITLLCWLLSGLFLKCGYILFKNIHDEKLIDILRVLRFIFPLGTVLVWLTRRKPSNQTNSKINET